MMQKAPRFLAGDEEPAGAFGPMAASKGERFVTTAVVGHDAGDGDAEALSGLKAMAPSSFSSGNV
jgi:hypothetical protein